MNTFEILVVLPLWIAAIGVWVARPGFPWRRP